MKIYKYREVDSSDDESISRLTRIVRGGLIWCARPDALNDPEEFAWTCDFTPSPKTLDVLGSLLQKANHHPAPEARRRAHVVLERGVLETLGRPVIADMIRKVRDEVGIACFGSTPDNPILWSRYAGDGKGVAIEIDVPSSVLGRQLHRVIYDDDRIIHIDDFIRSMDEQDAAIGVYATLLTKSRAWSPEQEIRFLSKHQQVEVHIDGSAVTGIVRGAGMSADDIAVVDQIAEGIPVVPHAGAA